MVIKRKKRKPGIFLFLVLGLSLVSPFLVLNRSSVAEAGPNAVFLSSSEDSLFRPIKKNNAEILDLNAGNALSVFVDFDKNKEKILYGKNENSPAPIASMSKLMTAIVVTENYDLNTNIVMNKENAEALSRTGVDVRSGEEVSVNSLLQIMLIESNNAAADALTQNMGREAFVDEMNRKAKDLELADTVFYNPSGLDISVSVTNTSTPMDLRKIAVYIIKKHPLISDICSIDQMDVYSGKKLLKRLKNTNILLKSGGDYLWGKTGYTEDANGCIILILKRPFGSISEHDNEYIINVIMGADGKVSRFLEAQKMEDWIINSYIW
jgi:D-alanyl-D-alanine endopeptidase (penicillin-binding protein 7)